MEAILHNKLVKVFEQNKQQLLAQDSDRIKKIKREAFDDFLNQGLPTHRLESWKNTNLKRVFDRNYSIEIEPPHEKVDTEKVLQCEIPDFDTHIISLYNGWYISQGQALQTLPNGTVIGSFASAMKVYPELIEKHYNKYCNNKLNGLNALNTAFAQDGIFIYVPDGVETYKSLQMVNILNRDHELFVQNRNLIILGKNSKLKLVHCDDSHNHQASLTSSVTEFFMDEGSQLEHYKLQNLNDSTTLINSCFFHQEKDSQLKTFAISLNGGLIRNDIRVKLNGEGADANVFGLYLMDKEQHVDNQVFVHHAKPNCTSNELFKGILDDHASGVFNGHILVEQDAQQTNAFQTNRNVLLTDKAKVNTKPFLEIYADDVKCSHGATVGQLDDDALFYIKSRGISGYNAKLLLMYAFAAEVIQKINLIPLHDRIDDLVKKRLRGELAICDQCVLHCNSQENVYEFAIDMSKI